LLVVQLNLTNKDTLRPSDSVRIEVFGIFEFVYTLKPQYNYDNNNNNSNDV